MDENTKYELEKQEAKWRWAKEGRWPKCDTCGQRAIRVLPDGTDVCREHDPT